MSWQEVRGMTNPFDGEIVTRKGPLGDLTYHQRNAANTADVRVDGPNGDDTPPVTPRWSRRWSIEAAMDRGDVAEVERLLKSIASAPGAGS